MDVNLFFVAVAFALGFWAGAGWSGAMAVRYKNQRDEVIKRVDGIINKLNRALKRGRGVDPNPSS
jgi:hypothetical protein